MEYQKRAIDYIVSRLLPPASFAIFVFSESIFICALYRVIIGR
jgi:hypothetical protein